MDQAGEALYRLTPVTFRYKKELDPRGTRQYGLIAEEVGKVEPDLVVNDEDGKPATLRFLSIQAMMLNELLREHRKVEEQACKIREQKNTIAELKKELESVAARLKEHDAKIQRVSEQIALGTTVPRVASSE
jgi:hypothetical protein